MEKKQEEQARQMRELQDCAEHLQRENDHLRAHVEKMCNLGERDVQDSGQARHLTARDKGKELIIPNYVDTSADNEMSSGSSPNLSPEKKVARLGRAKDTRIALHSAMPIMARSVGQEEK